MGQQIPFQTLDQVATGLLKRQDEHGSPPGRKSTQVDRFNAGFDTWALRLAIVAGALFLLWWILHIARGVLRDLGEGRWHTLIVTACVVALAGLAVRLGFAFVDIFSGLSIEVVRGGLA